MELMIKKKKNELDILDFRRGDQMRQGTSVLAHPSAQTTSHWNHEKFRDTHDSRRQVGKHALSPTHESGTRGHAQQRQIGVLVAALLGVS